MLKICPSKTNNRVLLEKKGRTDKLHSLLDVPVVADNSVRTLDVV